MRRYDVERAEPRYAPWVIKREVVTHAPAAVVTSQRKSFVAKLFHKLHHRLHHRAFRVRRMIGAGFWRITLPVAGKVGNDEPVLRRKRGRKAMPHHVRLRIAVQEQERRSITADAREEFSRARFNEVGFVAGKQVSELFHGNSLQRAPANVAPTEALWPVD